MEGLTFKTFVLEKAQTQESQIVEYEVSIKGKLVSLRQLFQQHSLVGKGKFQIYDPKVNKYISLSRASKKRHCVPKEMLQPTFILIKYTQDCLKTITSQSEQCSNWLEQEDSGADNLTKSKERTINQVIEVVKKWRNLHKYGSPVSKKRLNLLDASKAVGVSRKTLDDYYCMLRLAQKTHFDFVNNLNQKMGVLRAHVRQNRSRQEQRWNRKNRKHPKELKILNYFDLENRKLVNLEQMMKEEEYESLVIRQPSTESGQEQKQDLRPLQLEVQPLGDSVDSILNIGEPYISHEMVELESSFFNTFKMAPQEQEDPYYDINQGFQIRCPNQQVNRFMFF